ncbi:HAD family hydrolase [Eubacterium ramulus]|uniref:HAD family hydrolase n=1 Tax=Eubacterium ramulus TaxID=39490 RepID=UPI003520B226
MGNVLMRYDPEVPLREYVSSEEARDLIRKELFQGPEWVERDRGTISIEEMYESVAKRIPEQYHEELKKCVYGWDICMEPLEKSVKLCEDARKWGTRRMCFPMQQQMSFIGISRNFSPLEAFDGVMVSSEVHLIKPDVRIYECLLEKYQLKPEECLFFDDRKDNVEGAREAGMQAMVFTEDYESPANIFKGTSRNNGR